MIRIPGEPGKDLCDKHLGVTRWDILRIGGSGLLGLSLGGAFKLQALANPAATPASTPTRITAAAPAPVAVSSNCRSLLSAPVTVSHFPCAVAFPSLIESIGHGAFRTTAPVSLSAPLLLTLSSLLFSAILPRFPLANAIFLFPLAAVGAAGRT